MAAPPPDTEACTPPDASRRDVAVQTEPPSLSPEEQLRVAALVRPAARLLHSVPRAAPHNALSFARPRASAASRLRK